MENIIFRGATKDGDIQQLKELYYTAFYPERVDEFAEILYNHQPNLPNKNWLVAEDTALQKIVAAIVLIPWKWKIVDVEINMAEFGIVATLPEYRGKGLMHKLNLEFEHLMQENDFFVSGIQGIPGFYYKLGYEYAVELENKIIVPLHLLEQEQQNYGYSIRKADFTDIPFLMQEDAEFNKKYGVSVVRTKENFEYQLTYGLKTECEADSYIIEKGSEQCYFKIYRHGFGSGLNITEFSENATIDQIKASMFYLKSLAKEADKPFVRLNMHRASKFGSYAISLGAQPGKSYAWQIKITNKLALLEKLKPVFNQRIKDSAFRDFSGVFRLNFYQSAIDLYWDAGELIEIKPATEGEEPFTFAINPRWFPRLIFGHNSWEELHDLHPDVSPAILSVESVSGGLATFVGEFMHALFPKQKGWINLQY